MSDMSRETRDLIARGRAGTSMPVRRRNAVKGAVLAKVAAGTLVTTSATAAAWTSTTKVIGAAVVALAIGGGTVGVVKYENAKAERTKTAALATATQTRNPADLPIQNAPPAEPTPAQIAVAPQTTAGIETPAVVAAPVPTPIGRPTSTSTSTPKSTLDQEVSLLREAHDALSAGDPNRALALLDEHAHRFPQSALEPERSAERVFAYCAENASDAARGAASSFLAAHPAGPLADRVRASCGGHEVAQAK